MKQSYKTRRAMNVLALLAPMLSYGELVLRPVTIAERKIAAFENGEADKK
jgi:hypothetical protein